MEAREKSLRSRNRNHGNVLFGTAAVMARGKAAPGVGAPGHPHYTGGLVGLQEIEPLPPQPECVELYFAWDTDAVHAVCVYGEGLDTDATGWEAPQRRLAVGGGVVGEPACNVNIAVSAFVSGVLVRARTQCIATVRIHTQPQAQAMHAYRWAFLH